MGALKNIYSLIKGMRTEYEAQCEKVIVEQKTEYDKLKLDYDSMKTYSELLEIQLSFKDSTELDNYCKRHFKEVPKIVYKKKRKIKQMDSTVSIHELVTPDCYLLDQLLKKINIDGKDLMSIAKLYGNRVANELTWTDDKNLDTSGDYYLYPSETLALKKADCEDHTIVMMSSHYDIGGAWGFYGKGGHAFNVFLYNQKLYILDTVGNKAHIEEYTPQSKYKINYIITKNYAYEVTKGVTFGEIAGW